MTRERVLKLPVLEIFGPTFQGEGRAIGQKTMFVRTAGCDYHCDWCDCFIVFFSPKEAGCGILTATKDDQG